MNATARRLGMTSMHFSNFDGLPWPTEESRIQRAGLLTIDLAIRAIGEHFLAADHGDRTRPQVLARAAGLLLGEPG